MDPSGSGGDKKDTRDVTRSSASSSYGRFFEKFYGKNVLNLKPKFRVRHPFTWGTVFFAFVIIVLVLGSRSPIKADVSDFSPALCSGTWAAVTNAEGRPDTLTNTSTSFSPANSAMFAATGTYVYCGGFLPSDYDATGTITSVGVTLVWQVGDGRVVFPADGSSTGQLTDTSDRSTSTVQASSTDINTVDATTTDTSTTTDASTTLDASTTVATTTDATTTDAGPANTTTTIAPTDASGTSIATTTTITPPTDASPTTTTDSTTSPPAPAPAPSPASSSDNTSNGSASSSASLFLKSLLAHLVLPALADDTLTSTPPFAATSTATDTIPLPPQPAPPPPDADFLKVSYSIDGQNWITLHTVNLGNWPNLTLGIPVATWQDLANLQIKVEDIPTTQSPIPDVLLDGMFVEVRYSVPLDGALAPSPIYTDFTTDKTAYTQGEPAQVTGAPAESSIEIYSLDNFDSPGMPAHVYATKLDNTGGTVIDTNTLSPGRYALVNTFDSGSCNEYSMSDCEARPDYISEEDIIVATSSSGP